MLPLGRKNARKCSECDITCHANCAHLVPDFCGMSMETANKLLSDWREINRARGGQAVRPSPQTQTYSPTAPPSSDAAAQIGPGMDRMRLTGGPEFAPSPVDPFGRPPLKPPPQERPGADYPQQPPPQQSGPMMGYNLPPSARPPPGARIPIPPGYPQDQLLLNQQQNRPPMGYEQVPQAAPDGFPAPYQVGRVLGSPFWGLW